MAEERIEGKVVTDEQVQAWANEAERGHPVDELRRRGRPTKGVGRADVVPVRMDPTLLKALDDFAASHDVSRSDAIREAVRRHIDAT